MPSRRPNQLRCRPDSKAQLPRIRAECATRGCSRDCAMSEARSWWFWVVDSAQPGAADSSNSSLSRPTEPLNTTANSQSKPSNTAATEPNPSCHRATTNVPPPPCHHRPSISHTEPSNTTANSQSKPSNTTATEPNPPCHHQRATTTAPPLPTPPATEVPIPSSLKTLKV
ncbi:hypothetical protein Drorol1_Dr00025378 [Drosera rotundifolia]